MTLSKWKLFLCGRLILFITRMLTLLSPTAGFQCHATQDRLK